jgi:hypothetical protein
MARGLRYLVLLELSNTYPQCIVGAVEIHCKVHHKNENLRTSNVDLLSEQHQADKDVGTKELHY